ncbi:serine carboxypeptidase [Macrolepiota fuliginosa MF-IS2]|uniref:Carboxypeptidase n=1 Tax=Macrolepiota fuliginosa MF-IS2 TaxID=1400762 RepID=A0A9P5X6W7_9AGAR|nr:serine carboxypeptidase [Macrolepiota fuliginosa MF-IS2]
MFVAFQTLVAVVLCAIPDKEWGILSHPLFPSYSVRIKKNEFCDDTVNGYTGYIDIQARHLFFYFFESRNDPDKDDVIFWTNGGPGCSSSIGLFFELGPCRILDEKGPKFHPESWNTNANVFFIDQPIGVGFSYADFGETVSNSEDAAIDIAAFVAIFFENFSQFKGRAFHMAGESYGGRYLPLFASAVYDQNAVLVEAGLAPINLTSAMIGNGLTDSFTTLLSYYDAQCTPALFEPVLDISTCVDMKHKLERCDRWMRKACISHFDKIDCDAAYNYCGTTYVDPYYFSGKNPYDISKMCDGSVEETLCYPQTVHISKFLSDPANRAMLGVDPSIKGNFTSCNMDIETSFILSGDFLHPTTDYVAALLERGVRVLIYVGAYDWICNFVGNERWTLGMDWSGKEEFGATKKREWLVDGKRAGVTRSARGLTYATIDGAGHMVPYDKPKEALEMVQRWMAKEEL